MAEPLPLTNRCDKCGEWFHNAHVCANSIKISKDAALSASPATAEPVQQDTRDEAVAWMVKWYGSDGHEFVNATASKLVAQQHALRVGGKVIDLYATHHPVQPEEAVARDALKQIASADPGEGGCYYTNRVNISIAKKALAALSRQQDAGERT